MSAYPAYGRTYTEPWGPQAGHQAPNSPVRAADLYDPPVDMTGLGSHGGAARAPDAAPGHNSWGAGYHDTQPSQSTMMFAENEDEERRQLEMDKGGATGAFDVNEVPKDLYDPAANNHPAAPPTLLSNATGPTSGPAGENPRDGPAGPTKFTDPSGGGYSYPEPLSRGQRLLQAVGLRPVHPQIASQMRQKGQFRRQQRAVFAYILAVIYVAILIAELVESSQKTGSAIQTHPSINPMIGPGSIFLINFGARSGGCMRPMPGIDTATFKVPCLNVSNADSTTQATQQCSLAEICDLSNPAEPDQTWRLFSPIVSRPLHLGNIANFLAQFMHTGVIHLLVNVIVQVTLCAETERLLGSLIFLPLYLLSGVAGNLLGSDFGLVLQTSVGASGAIFSSIGVELVDIAYNWQYEWRAGTRLFATLVIALISIGLGLLPYMDNFAHIGGFATGIFAGMVVCSSIHPSRSHRAAIWICRLVGLGLLAAFLISTGLVFKNAKDPQAACHWCRYLSCLPVFSQCKGNGLTYNITSSGSGAASTVPSHASASPTGSASNTYNFGGRALLTPLPYY